MEADKHMGTDKFKYVVLNYAKRDTWFCWVKMQYLPKLDKDRSEALLEKFIPLLSLKTWEISGTEKKTAGGGGSVWN